jgi:hypothetical protein
MKALVVILGILKRKRKKKLPDLEDSGLEDGRESEERRHSLG